MRRSRSTTELVTVVFTDIVSSTEIAEEVGDRHWRALIAAHHDLVRQALRRHSGRELDTAGDGFFAVFAKPADAIRCAVDVSQGVREFGLEIRAGLHLGEAEVIGDKVGGVAVNTGARIMSLGEAGEVLVSATVRDAVAGKGIVFVDHGIHQLKGLEGAFQVFDVASVDGVALGLPFDAEEARRRREQHPADVARRRPWWLVAAAAIVVVAVIGIGIASWRDDGSPTPTGTSLDERRPLSGADQELVGLVPAGFAATCVTADPLPTNAVGSVLCNDREFEVQYETYADAGALEAAFASAAAGLDVSGPSCLTDRTATGPYTIDGGQAGRVACFVERPTAVAQYSAVVWTDESLLVLGRASRSDLTEYPVNAPDLTLYEWWRTRSGPGSGGSFRPKDGAAELPAGTFELVITKDEVGAASDGLADERWLGTTRVEFDKDTLRVTYPDGTPFQADLLWGKEDRLVYRERGVLGTDFGRVQCPRYASWNWRLEGGDLVLSDPSPGACDDLRHLLAFEPLVPVG